MTAKLDNIKNHLKSIPAMPNDGRAIESGASNLFHLFDVLVQIEKSRMGKDQAQ